MSAWDELDKDSAATGSSDADASGNGNGGDADDGYDDANDRDGQSYDEAELGDVDDAQVIDSPPAQAESAKKKNLKLLLIGVGVLGVVLLGGMVYAVSSAMSSGGNQHSQEVASAEVIEESADASSGMLVEHSASDASAGMLSDVPSHESASAVQSAATAPLDPASAVAAPPVAASAVAVAATPAAAAVAPVVAAVDGALPGKVDRLESRVDAIAQDIEEIKRRLSSGSAVGERRAVRSEVRRAAVSGKVAKASKAKGQKKSVESGGAAEVAKTQAPSAQVATAPARAEFVSALDGLSLRAVNPPSGPDMQAWIMDGDKVTVVAKGSVVRGARVTLVESDRVVTTAGVIR